MSKREPNLIDVTIKEGGFRINHCLLPEQVADIAQGLQRAGVQWMEVSHGCGIGSFKKGFPGLHSDKVLLKAARKAAPQLQYSVFISGSESGVLEIEPIQDLFELGRVGISVHEVERIEPHLKKLKDLKKQAIGQLLRIHSVTPEQTAQSAKRLETSGADGVYLVDTYGSLGPQEIKDYVHAVQAQVKIPIGFQARNHLGRALQTALAAWDAGAQWLDASLLGMGRGGGVTNLEILVHLFQQKGLKENIQLNELTRSATNYVLPAIRSLPFSRRIDLLFAQQKIDFYPEALLEKLAELLEIPLETFLKELRQLDPQLIQLKETHLREYLAQEKLDFDVVLAYFKTGKIPQT